MLRNRPFLFALNGSEWSAGFHEKPTQDLQLDRVLKIIPIRNQLSPTSTHRLTILSTVLSVSRRAESNGNWNEKKFWKMRKMKSWMLLSHHFSGSYHQKTFEGRLIVYQNSFQIQDWCNIQLDNWFLRSLISLASRCARLTESLTTLANSPSIALRSFSPRLQN